MITERTVRSNGIDLHIAEAGEGPLVVLCHGFPELSYSWRHQLPALAAAGYHAVAPDQRGYGRTTCPSAIEDYDIVHLSGDILGLMDALGEESAVVVGHDWGSNVLSDLVLRAPARVRAAVWMSVPFIARPPAPPVQIFRQIFTDTWFYMLYFQEPGVADANLGRDPETSMRRFMSAVSGESDLETLMTLGGLRDGRGMVERMPEPDKLPRWLSQEELDHYAGEFERTGFTGGLNWYRNLDRNWELREDFAGGRVSQPCMFVGGQKDPVLLMSPPDGMRALADDLRDVVLIPDAGHWVQQETPDEVNAALLEFLADL